MACRHTPLARQGSAYLLNVSTDSLPLQGRRGEPGRAKLVSVLPVSVRIAPSPGSTAQSLQTVIFDTQTTSAPSALGWSVVMTLLALIIFGYVKGRFTGTRPARSALQTVLVGGLAAAAAFAIARAVG